MHHLIIRYNETLQLCRHHLLGLVPLHRVQVSIQPQTPRMLLNRLKSWWNNENPRVCTGAPHRPKFLIWARAVLISKFEKGFLERAGIIKGVLASLYQVENCWPLLEAFISFLELRRTYHRHLSRGDGLSVVGPSGCYGDSHLWPIV